MYKKILFSSIFILAPVIANADTVASLLDDYRQAGASDFSSQRGDTLWNQASLHAKSGKARSCNDCHTNDLTQPGKHVKTGKPIAPMAPSVNQERLTDGAKIEKWFKRNCKWTLGRECTPQEKGDFLLYLQQL